jgi:hypothetical protein
VTADDVQVGPTSATDTTPQWGGLSAVRRARLWRRALLAVFGTFLLLGASGVFGVRTGRASASTGGYTLNVEYPRVTRAGHAVPLSFTVHHPGGFGDDPVQLSLNLDYLNLYDANATYPAASAETATDDAIIWEFDPPPGDVLQVRLDTRTGPNRQQGERAEVAVLVDDAPVVRVRFRTRVMP